VPSICVMTAARLEGAVTTSLHRKEMPALTFTARMGCESR
jgi:hypothetical protein